VPVTLRNARLMLQCLSCNTTQICLHDRNSIRMRGPACSPTAIAGLIWTQHRNRPVCWRDIEFSNLIVHDEMADAAGGDRGANAGRAMRAFDFICVAGPGRLLRPKNANYAGDHSLLLGLPTMCMSWF
jgi:hypothetical protein